VQLKTGADLKEGISSSVSYHAAGWNVNTWSLLIFFTGCMGIGRGFITKCWGAAYLYLLAGWIAYMDLKADLLCQNTERSNRASNSVAFKQTIVKLLEDK
jgi:hypothetical protein